MVFMRGLKINKVNIESPIITEIKPSVAFCVQLKVGQGKESKPLIKVGETVKQGTVIAAPDGDTSGFVYSPVNGAVLKIETKINTFGENSTCVIIEAAKVNTPLFFNKLESFSANNLFGRLIESGSFDNWGKRMPTYHKYLNPNAKNERILVIKTFDSDPYILSNEAITEQYTEEVVKGAICFYRISGASKMFFIVPNEKSKQPLIAKIREIASKLEVPQNLFDIITVDNVYPYDENHLLCDILTGKEISVDEDVENRGIMIENSQSCLNFERAVYENRPVISSVYTIAGDNLAHNEVVEIYNGTLPQELLSRGQVVDLEKFRGFVLGGALSGLSQCDRALGLPLTYSAILTFKWDDSKYKEIDCINCGRCNEVCPMRLNPMSLDNFAINKDYGRAKKYGALSCINCGCCSYVCPARRFLSQRISDMADSIRLGRTM